MCVDMVTTITPGEIDVKGGTGDFANGEQGKEPKTPRWKFKNFLMGVSTKI